jgi:hypothetical protein
MKGWRNKNGLGDLLSGVEDIAQRNKNRASSKNRMLTTIQHFLHLPILIQIIGIFFTVFNPRCAAAHGCSMVFFSESYQEDNDRVDVVVLEDY